SARWPLTNPVRRWSGTDLLVSSYNSNTASLAEISDLPMALSPSHICWARFESAAGAAKSTVSPHCQAACSPATIALLLCLRQESINLDIAANFSKFHPCLSNKFECWLKESRYSR